jgi:hypothetical protein
MNHGDPIPTELEALAVDVVCGEVAEDDPRVVAASLDHRFAERLRALRALDASLWTDGAPLRANTRPDDRDLVLAAIQGHPPAQRSRRRLLAIGAVAALALTTVTVWRCCSTPPEVPDIRLVKRLDLAIDAKSENRMHVRWSGVPRPASGWSELQIYASATSTEPAWRSARVTADELVLDAAVMAAWPSPAWVEVSMHDFDGRVVVRSERTLAR